MIRVMQVTPHDAAFRIPEPHFFPYKEDVMGCVNTTPETWREAPVNVTTTVYIWFTGWVPAVGLDSVKALLFRKNTGTYVQSQVAYQTAATRPSEPDAPGVLGNAQTGNGAYCMSLTDISATTASKMYIRFGVALNLTQGNPDKAEVGMQFCTVNYGTILSSKEFDLLAPDTTSLYVPVTDWFPSVMISKSKAVFNLMNPTATFRCRMAYQTAATRVESPSTWSSNDGWKSTSGEVNTTEVTATSSDFWMRLGIEYQCSSGTNQSANVKVVTGIRK